MAIDRICVVGAGAIGSLLAGHLAAVSEVSVLTRRRQHARDLAQKGLRISGKSDRHVRLAATTDPSELAEPDLIIVATKATQLEEAVGALADRFAGAVVMTTQNGLGAEEVVRAAGDWPIVSAVTFMSGIRHGDCHVEYELDTPTWLGPYGATATPPALVHEIGDLLVRAGLKAEPLPDLLPAQWSKLIFNSAVNTVAALTGLPHVAAFARVDEPGDLGHVVHGLVEEGRAVAAAAGIALHGDPWEMNVRAVARGETAVAGGAYAHLPSMLEDVLARSPTEVDWITGALVRRAGELGVDTPLNAALWRLVRGREASWALGDGVTAHATEATA